MHLGVTTALTAYFLFLSTRAGLSQIGETKEQLGHRYGSCSPNPAGKPSGPNVYDNVIDVGEACTFHHDQIVITAFFKSGGAVELDYRKTRTFWDSIMHGKGYSGLPLSDKELSDLLRTAVPNAEWIPISQDGLIHQWRTNDSSAFAYYFVGGHYDLYVLQVQTADVDAVFRKVNKYYRREMSSK